MQSPSKSMAISNELSSDIAAAILNEKKTPQELKQLKEVILRVHSALQKMSAEERANRLRGGTKPPTALKSQASQ
jgi:predicted transcriptional regulator